MTSKQRPHVLLDGLVFENKTQYGIWRLFYETIARTTESIDYTVLLARPAMQQIPDGVQVERWQRPPLVPSRRLVIKTVLSMPSVRRIERKYPDAIWHSTFYTCDPRARKKSVVTVYDMIAESHYAIGPFELQRAMKERALRDPQRVLAISKTTATDLQLYYPQIASRIVCMHPGAEHLTRSTTSLGDRAVSESSPVSSNSAELIHAVQSSNSGEPIHVVRSSNSAGSNASASSQASRAYARYCLYVGGRYAYKNFTVVVRALTQPSWPSEVKLVVAGEPFDPAEQAFLQAHGVASRVRHVGKVSDEQLRTLYGDSIGLIMPSLHEGFGIPILEAQAAGTVPILSDIPIFREAAGEGALFFDPCHPDALAHAIREAMLESTRGRIVQAAQQNVSRYRWSDAADTLKACYESLA